VIVRYSVPNTTKTVVLIYWVALQRCSVPTLKSSSGKKLTVERCGGGGKQSSRCNRGSTSCAPRSGNCISCAPKCLLHVYQLRPELSTPSMTSCVPRKVRNCVSCIGSYGNTKCPTIGRCLHSFIVLYFIHNYIHTRRIVERYRQRSCYIMLLSNV